MRRLSSDACLAALSAGLTSLTFKMRDWTGIHSSGQWPIGGAIGLMIVWLVAQRRDGVRTSLLLASLIGIGVGLTVSAISHQIAVHKPIGVSLIFLLTTVACTLLYVRAARSEADSAVGAAKLEEEFEVIKSMPPHEAAEALRAKLSAFERELGTFERSWERWKRLAGILIGLAMLVTIASLPSSFSPEPKPVEIVVDAALISLGCAWFVMIARSRISRKRGQRNAESS